MTQLTTRAEPVAKKTGRLPPKSDPRALMFSRFASAPRVIPKRTTFWARRSPFAMRTFGNLQYGNCTRAKQAIAAMRMERIETRNTPALADEEIIRVYLEMTRELYGGGDTGAYETDALSRWRRPEHTFRDTKGRALTIDAYVRINHSDHQELRAALWASETHGIAVCLNLPEAFRRINAPAQWDIPDGQAPIGDWMPGSWQGGGGHSMWARDYDEDGIWLVHTWNLRDQLITWRAAALYVDEAHLVIDSLDYWRERKPRAARYLDLPGIHAAVNRVSSQKIP